MIRYKVILIVLFCITACGGKSEPSVYSVQAFLKNKEKLAGKKISVEGYFYDIPFTTLYEDEISAKSYEKDYIMLVDETSSGEMTNSPCLNNYVYFDGVVLFDDRYGTYLISQIDQIKLKNGDVCFNGRD